MHSCLYFEVVLFVFAEGLQSEEKFCNFNDFFLFQIDKENCFPARRHLMSMVKNTLLVHDVFPHIKCIGLEFVEEKLVYLFFKLRSWRTF